MQTANVRFYRPLDIVGRLICRCTGEPWSHVALEYSGAVFDQPIADPGGWYPEQEHWAARPYHTSICLDLPAALPPSIDALNCLVGMRIPIIRNVLARIGLANPIQYNCVTATISMLRLLGVDLPWVTTPGELYKVLNASPYEPHGGYASKYLCEYPGICGHCVKRLSVYS